MDRAGKSSRSTLAALRAFGVNAGAVEDIQERFDVDPASVDASWADHFDGASASAASTPTTADAATAPDQATENGSAANPPTPGRRAPRLPRADQLAERHARVLRMIHAYRSRGHRIANTDPLEAGADYFPELDPAHYGFGHDDFDQSFIAGNLPGGAVQTLREIVDRLRTIYCRTVGVEFTHIQDPGRRAWIQSRVEESGNSSPLENAERLRILRKLAASELFERFLATRFLGQKRFSLEGSEALIPLLDTVVEQAPGFGGQELVIGMAHRGRLNVLSNILDKSLESIFSEFEDTPDHDSPFGSGDVKYHKGFSIDRRVASGERVHLSLTANPSHLEAVDPVVCGRARAKQARAGDTRGERVIPVLVHGDAAFAGQGIVAETLNLSDLAGYSVGGTIHVVVNNQIGFTTTAAEARSTLYCTDVAKMIQAPIFHVNGDDVEAVVHVVKLAMLYRSRFGQDVVIDLVCYRRHGHNEGDEPNFTQPLLYEKIRRKDSARQIYTQKLIERGELTRVDAERIERELQNQLDSALDRIESKPPGPDEPYEPNGPWTGFQRVCGPDDDPDTGVPIERLAQIAERIGTVPEGFAAHPKVCALLKQRHKRVAEGGPIDWGLGEALAFGSLLVEGTPVRLSGQDSCRGTFSHRHAAIIDQRTEAEHFALDHVSQTQARFEAYDSLLSEAAVLGFEYGYSLADPTTLTIWEAQFGDFVNGAQVIIDQFVSTAHVKWQRMSGLVMLLPHGFEGQGPEHSSARVERFLQSCADDAMQVVNCTTPAQYFHVLRRQMRRPYRAPLVVFSPKSLLRSPDVSSSAADLAEGRFQQLLDDPLTVAAPERVERVILCSGKVYYDLLAARESHSAEPDRVALIRVEQLYPWPAQRVAQITEQYANANWVTWAQEEPANMGAWTFVRERIQGELRPTQKLAYAGRRESASPATGSMRIHKREQAELLASAFARLRDV
jgi:2-oxoglutarate dehydrogenase E1 component